MTHLESEDREQDRYDSGYESAEIDGGLGKRRKCADYNLATSSLKGKGPKENKLSRKGKEKA